MNSIRDVVRDLLDGRENDEQITVEVSLLWSLLDAPLDEERLARALMEVAPDMKVTGQGRAFIRPSAAGPLAAAIAKAYREDSDA